MSELKSIAQKLGFSACGTARLHEVDADTMHAFDHWIESGRHGAMAYMEKYRDIRQNPRLLMPTAESIIVVALGYTPKQRLPEDEWQIADYALGKDYHDLMRERLRMLAEEAGLKEFRVCVDTAPILERYWAVEAGLGWIGKNRQLIIPHLGSRFFLGEILVEDILPESKRQRNHCGNCTKCVDACPTKVLPTFDARKCLSYLTIENRDSIPQLYASKMDGMFYGCDRCQNACPWNRFSVPTSEPHLQPSQELMAMKKADWQTLTEEQYQRLFKGSAVKRVKYAGLKRNIEALY